jgi:2-oxoglutarate dehydrogenase E2 component (dihydrolipoamide succinyltransferase)
VAIGTIVDVVMPQMGVSVSEGTITKWLKTVGDAIAADESLLEISTDKVDTEVPSPSAGVVTEILVQEGETVTVGTVLARIGEAGVATVAPPIVETPPAPVEAAQPPPATEPEREPEPESHANGHDEGHTFVSPVVARIAAEHGIDPAGIAGTGKGGRVTKKDILAIVESPAPATPEPPATPVAEPAPTESGSDPGQTRVRAGSDPGKVAEAAFGESIEPMNAMRRGIAEHMRRSLDTAAHVTSAIEVDMSKVAAIREQLKAEYVSSYGVNPTYLAFIARATVETLRDWPWVNGELRDGSIVTHSYVNLGFAVSLEDGKGLIVPVVKNAEGLNLLGMARAIADVAARARSKKLNPDDVTGGTFTITNPGSFGTFMGTPVISQPQSGILGTYAVVKRPWVIQDEAGQDAIAIRPIMNLTLTYDHRLVDGAYGAQFLRDLAHRLQTWGESDY